ncbi:hypothetical protein ACQKP0_16520 [Heyndrickxia sp. NPDC080065]|uniref:hypothetical protein n=1 Tax=Heyndrickxia sp. NPDC080065 TaxID=3390568 RepID=UPI003D00AD21
MTAFKGLLKKDFCITRFWFFTWLIIMVLLMLASIVIAVRIEEPMITVGLVVMLLVGNLVFLPISLLTSLRLEGKTQIWLYNPHSSKFLILSKITVALLYQLISLGVIAIYSLLIVHYIVIDKTSGIINVLFWADISVICIGLYLSCWILFYWSIYHSLSKYPAIRKFKWLVIVLTIFVCNTIEVLLLKIKWFVTWINKWKVSIPLDRSFNYQNHAWHAKVELVDVSIIPIIIYAIVGILLFMLSSWLLDRKVEV